MNVAVCWIRPDTYKDMTWHGHVLYGVRCRPAISNMYTRQQEWTNDIQTGDNFNSSLIGRFCINSCSNRQLSFRHFIVRWSSCFYHFKVNLLTVFLSSPHSWFVDCLFVTSQLICRLSFRQFTVNLSTVILSLHSQIVEFFSLSFMTVKLLIVQLVTSQSNCWLTFIPSQSNCWPRSTNYSQIFKSHPMDFSQLIVPFIISPSQIVGFTCFRSWRRRYSIHKRCPSVGKGRRATGANSTSRSLLLLQKRKKSKRHDREDDL